MSRNFSFNLSGLRGPGKRLKALAIVLGVLNAAAIYFYIAPPGEDADAPPVIVWISRDGVHQSTLEAVTDEPGASPGPSGAPSAAPSAAP